MIDLSGQAQVSIGPSTISGLAGAYGGHSNWNIADSGDVGVKLSANRKARLRDLDISNIAGTGVDARGPGTWQDYTLIEGVAAKDCYRGFYFHDAGEYAQVVGCKAANCVYGAHVDAGNVHFTNFEAVYCSIGVKVSGGVNNAHGTFTGGSLTHCAYLMTCLDVTLGETFQNMNMLAGQAGADQGVIQIINSKGIAIHGGQIAYADITIDATSQVALRNVTLRGPVNVTVAAGGLFDAKNNIVMPGALLTLNGIPWSGNT